MFASKEKIILFMVDYFSYSTYHTAGL